MSMTASALSNGDTHLKNWELKKVIIFVVIKLIILIALAVLFVELLLGTDLAIDTCLDRGGKWDYENERCVYQ